MLLNQLTINSLLFALGVFGIILNKRSLLTVLICLELALLGLNLNFITFSIYLDDFYGQVFCLFILTVAAAESAVGLAIIIVYYRQNKTIALKDSFIIRG